MVGDAEGGEDRATYVLAGDQLTLNGVPLQLVRAGKGEALKPKGRLAKKAGAKSRPSRAEWNCEAREQRGRHGGCARRRALDGDRATPTGRAHRALEHPVELAVLGSEQGPVAGGGS